MRPWKTTPEDEANNGPYPDYAAFERWFYESIDETLPEGEDFILDNLTPGQQTHLYSTMCDAFDAFDEATQ